VTDVEHMAYMSRAGLFGPGTAFQGGTHAAAFDAFKKAVKKRGMAFLEMLAMQLKADGLYASRGLSFRGCEAEALPCPLDEAAVAVYDASSELWSRMWAARGGDGARGLDKSMFHGGRARFFRALLSALKVPAVVQAARRALDEGNAVVIGLQSTGEAAAARERAASAAADEGGASFDAPVSAARDMLIQFIKGQMAAAEEGVEEEEGEGEEGVQGVGGVRATSSPPPAPPSIWTGFLEEARALDLPPAALDALVDALGGPTRVAELTGRSFRSVRESPTSTRFVTKTRTVGGNDEAVNVAEAASFNAGTKLVAIISDAASTGVSLHAAITAANSRRRVHITAELAWAADKALQQLGRTHRAHQASAPRYLLAQTPLGGETRFAAAVAKRLQSLGALTRGDRRAAGRGGGADAEGVAGLVDTNFGKDALTSMLDALVTEGDAAGLLPPGVTWRAVRAAATGSLAGLPPSVTAHPCLAPLTGTAVADAAAQVAAVASFHGAAAHELEAVDLSPGADLPKGGEVKRFLNRLMACPVAAQVGVFAYFSAALDAVVAVAKEEGRFDGGAADIACVPHDDDDGDGDSQVLEVGDDGLPVLHAEEVWTDPLTRARLLAHAVTVDRGLPVAAATSKFAAAMEAAAMGGDEDGSAFYSARRVAPAGGRSLLLALARPPPHPGAPVTSYEIWRPNTGLSGVDISADDLARAYARLSPDAARPMWAAIHADTLRCMHGRACVVGASCTQGGRRARLTLLTGPLVAAWTALERVLDRRADTLARADRSLRVMRALWPDGRRLVGVRFPGWLLDAAREALAGGDDAHHDLPAASRAAPAPEAVAPVDSIALKRATIAPRTLHNFFKPKKREVDQGGEDGGQASAAAAPSSKKKKGRAAPAPAAAATAAKVHALTVLGFSADAAAAALAAAGGDVARAADALMRGLEG
jgi:hypothetical protein